MKKWKQRWEQLSPDNQREVAAQASIVATFLTAILVLTRDLPIFLTIVFVVVIAFAVRKIIAIFRGKV